jgi:hypothetical protein
MTYYKTVPESEEKLQEYRNKAASQESRIASFFELNPDGEFTPWEVQSLVFVGKTPITSVRRSMSDLARLDPSDPDYIPLLIKTDHMKEAGIYGRRSHTWKLNKRYYETLRAMKEIMTPENAQEGQSEEIKKYPTPTTIEPPKSKNGLILEPLLFDVPATGYRCEVCNRILSDPKSIDRGMGPVCNHNCSMP